MAACTEIIGCLAEEYKTLRQATAVLRSTTADRDQKREVAESLLPSLKAHIQAEEETFLARALECEPLRVLAAKALELHELLEAESLRLRQSADDNQFHARAGVLGDLLEGHLRETEATFFPMFRALVPQDDREALGVKFQEARDRNLLAPALMAC